MPTQRSRRDFLRATTLTAASGLLPWLRPDAFARAADSKSANARPRVGCIGNGGMGHGDAYAVHQFGDILAFCDVDRSHAEHANAHIAGGKAKIYGDYRHVLDRKDIDIVTVSTPDHWHTKIAADALRAGKDVYCQKPLTLTIAEGKFLCKVVKETGRVLQVGTQQRSEFNNMFLTAVAMVHEGRIGKVKRATCAIGGGPRGGPFRKEAPPTVLNWEMWLGQTPKVEYIKERCHNNFRWWYEYSGGKLTDWGAHHVDIAQWALGMDATGPTAIEVLTDEHPVKLDHGRPTVDDCYNTATRFTVRCPFSNGAEIVIRDNAPELGFDNGILFEGDKGKFFVDRGRLTGEPVAALKKDPIPLDVLVKLRKGKPLSSHMANFIACVRDRSQPVSDVYSHHRALTTCHLSNIALRLDRNLKWDAHAQRIVGDAEADAWLARKQRKGYEVV